MASFRVTMAEYYTKNFESYSEIFKEHATYLSELMKIMDDEIIGMGLPPVGRTKDLFRMVLDTSYAVDRAFREKHEIEADTVSITTFMSKDEIFSQMRSALSEEFARYMECTNGAE
jgi:hypothetical protein